MMPDICPYCLEKDLTDQPTTNKERHYVKCRRKNPYAKKKPPKQITLSFKPVSHQRAEATAEVEPTPETEASEQDFRIDAVVTDEDIEVDVIHEQDMEAEEIEDDDNDELSVIPSLEFDNESDEIVLVEGGTDVADVQVSSCHGFKPLVDNFFENFAFQLLPTMPHITLCGSSFHHVSCTEKHFHLQQGSNNSINEVCSALQNDEKLSVILDRGSKEQGAIHTKTNNIFLTHSQLSDKCKSLRKERNLMQLELRHKTKRVERLNSVLGLHKRFLVLLSQNDVLRVKELVAVALKNNRSINYIVDKVLDAVAGIYRARPSEKDKDLAFVVLKLGGPSLLNILYKANKLPSDSTAYRIGKGLKEINCSVTMTAGSCMDENFDAEYFHDSYTTSVKMDETYLIPRIRYNSKSNEFNGICYQHAPSNLKFNTFEDLEALTESIKNDQIHVPKETLVIGLSRLDCKSKFNVILAWPTCAKDDYIGTAEMVTKCSQQYRALTGKSLMNICTDGDSARRIVMHNFCDNDLSLVSPLHATLSDIPLLDLSCGPNEETVSYDPKHLVKRCWCACINETVSINGVVIYNDDLRQLLSLSADNSMVADSLVKPKDKQNVPNATKFMLHFINAVRDESVALPYRLRPIKFELRLLSYLFQGLLSFYAFTDISIATQIKSFSVAAHSLLYLYLGNKSKMYPNQLVHDIQATFQDAVFCCVKSKAYSPERPLYLVKNGTDPVESFFGVTRAQQKNCNLDNLEFIHCAAAITQVDDILSNKHPEWKKGGRLSKRLCLDHSSINDWEKDQLVLAETNIAARFRLGQLNVTAMIIEYGLKDVDFNDLARKNITFMKPFGKVIGVDDSDVDWSRPNDDSDDDDDVNSSVVDNSDMDNDDGDEDLDTDINLGDYLPTNHEATIDIDGKHVFKATCVKEAFSSKPMTKDRLKRVRTFTTPSSSEAPPKLLHIGDPVVVTGRNKLANIVAIKSANKPVKFINMNLLEADNLQFVVKQLALLEKEDKYFWTGEFVGTELCVTGKDCIPVQPEVILEMMDVHCTPYAFDKQLVLDIGVHLQQQPSDTMVEVSSSRRAPENAANAANSVSALRPCYVCQKGCSLEMMRGHIAFHIIQEECDNVCGFCGRGGGVCESSLKQSSHKKGIAYYEVVSSCEYKHAYKRVPDDVTKTHKCTNKVMKCPANNCDHFAWKYNGVHHYENKHPALAIPAEFVISDKEKKTVLTTFKL